ncbi:YrhK family protein [Acidimangrovimonas pyrenivorans]|uniref:YrhK family protein n=1 Tax=Acidimangrovimonas pyrenivorans TaxID=2030798 RepID=A0ABV7AGN0_9RHOB
MSLFNPDNRNRTPQHCRIWAAYEVAYTFVDFSAAGMFVIGSALFFDQATTYLATWLFLVGSICFGLKPTLRLVREIHLLRLGDVEDVAEELDV